MQGAVNELEVPLVGRLLGLGDRIPADSVADYIVARRATRQKPFLDGAHFELSRACRHDRLDQTVQGITAIVHRLQALVRSPARWGEDRHA